MKRMLLIALLCATPMLAACPKAPPNIGPQATAEFYATQTLHYLDAIRDAADNAHHTTPPLISAQTDLKVVNWHDALRKTLQATPSGWKATSLAGIDQLQTLVPATELAQLKASIDAARLYIQESGS